MKSNINNNNNEYSVDCMWNAKKTPSKDGAKLSTLLSSMAHNVIWRLSKPREISNLQVLSYTALKTQTHLCKPVGENAFSLHAPIKL